MIPTLLILLPIFGLILAGYLARLRGVMGPGAAGDVNRLVVWLALPALLFDIMAHTGWRAIWQPGFVGTFMLAKGLLFGAVLGWRLLARKPLADASIDAVAASYPNTGYVGFPLLLLLFGKDSLTPTTIATIIVACVFFAAAIALIEAGLQAERHPARLAARVAGAVLRNPLVLAPLAGAAFAGAGAVVPASVETFLKLLGGAASPCALVGLGLFLANQTLARTATPTAAPAPGGRATLAALVAAKLAVQPLLTWALATWVFALPAASRHMAVLLAALPTGTGPFMLAEYYRRDGALVAQVILATTVASVVTLVAAAAMMGIVPA
ncbi:AEC family transporter [uncultured Massilia sp.]|uniref:AEC family transporter n=1 Tax=uncultured Massilia sp. TaxID=169973 RepID=UPI0025F0531D|nr:AEC family transporter [uncultured Massilia sp.]